MAYLQRASYAFPMRPFAHHRDMKRVPSTPQTLDRFLKLLNSGSYQSDSVREILQTCALIRAAKDTLSDDLFKDLRDQSGINPKVWSKLLQIGVDDRLDALQDKLPPKYSTIHQIHCLTDKELKAAQDEEILYPALSQGVLNRWLKDYRVKGTDQELPEDFTPLVKVLGPADMSEDTLDRFKGDLGKLVCVYGLKTQYEGGDTMTSLRQQRSQDKSQGLVAILMKDLKSTWDGSDAEVRTLFELESLEDLVQSAMGTFTGFLNKVRGGRDGLWTFHGHDYLHKIALEYLKTDSRGQRFNYRRRMKEVAERHEQFAEKVATTLDECMKY